MEDFHFHRLVLHRGGGIRFEQPKSGEVDAHRKWDKSQGPEMSFGFVRERALHGFYSETAEASF